MKGLRKLPAKHARHARCVIKPKMRPGIARAFIQPVALKDQVSASAPKTKLEFDPIGKNLVGGVQWQIRMRPGLAKPLIIAKKEAAATQAMAKAVQAEAQVEQAVKQAGQDMTNAEVAKKLSGWFR